MPDDRVQFGFNRRLTQCEDVNTLIVAELLSHLRPDRLARRTKRVRGKNGEQ
jgi:hypothetical protein